MTDYERIAHLRLVQPSERRWEKRHRNLEAILYGAALVASAFIGAWLFVALMFSLVPL